jgi:methionyl-tRNA formyltransferase
MSNVLVVAQSKVWNPKLILNLRKAVNYKVVEIARPDQLNFKFLSELNPKFVFFPHWSSRITRDIFENFECVIFHMTDLPFGRGGSPLQNLIVRGFTETKISAIKCVAELDAGPIYMKGSLTLEGTAQQIFVRAAGIIEEMIVEIVKKTPQPTEQLGEVVVFERRNPNESEMISTKSVTELYDFIRMLDADGYPHAFIECGSFKIQFRNANISNGRLLADCIFLKSDSEG